MTSLFLSVATLQMKYKLIMIVQMQMFYLNQVVKKQLIKQRNTKNNITVNTTKKRCNNHKCVEFCGKTLSDSSNIKRNEQSKRCIEAKKTMLSEISCYQDLV